MRSRPKLPEKDIALSRKARSDEQEKQSERMREFLESHTSEELQYKDEYVRKLIDRIEVNWMSLTIKFKSGTEIEVPM